MAKTKIVKTDMLTIFSDISKRTSFVYRISDGFHAIGFRPPREKSSVGDPRRRFARSKK